MEIGHSARAYESSSPMPYQAAEIVDSYLLNVEMYSRLLSSEPSQNAHEALILL